MNSTTTASTCESRVPSTAVSGSMSSAPVNVAASHVLLSSSHLTNRDREGYSFADGHTAPE
jgi:hypothetical protein